MKNNIKHSYFQISWINLKKHSGFSLLEALISLSILTILLGLVFFGYNDYRKKSALKLGAEQVKSALDEAKNKALAPEKEISGKKPKSYFLYIDLSSANSANTIFIKKIYTDDTPDDETTENLPSRIAFSKIDPDDTVTNGTNGEIKFEVPEKIPNGKTITFDGYETTAPELTNGIGTIELKYNDNFYITITLNCYTGEIDIGSITNTSSL